MQSVPRIIISSMRDVNDSRARCKRRAPLAPGSMRGVAVPLDGTRAAMHARENRNCGIFPARETSTRTIPRGSRDNANLR
jgi:hypothetical protein